MEHLREDARALIRAAQEVHAERHGAWTFLPGTYLSFPEAAKRTGIRSDRQRYHDALVDLEYEGAIEWDPSAGGDSRWWSATGGLGRFRRGGRAVLSPRIRGRHRRRHGG